MFRASSVKGLLILLLFSVVAVDLHAQVAGGTISGTVTDSSGRVINNVQIAITNVATGVTRDIATNDEGFYSAPNLLPGTYEAKFSAKGFNTEVRADPSNRRDRSRQGSTTNPFPGSAHDEGFAATLNPRLPARDFPSTSVVPGMELL